MGRFWSILFLLVPIIGVGIFVCAMMTQSWPLYDHWLPVNISATGGVIDSLFNFILFLTGAIFVATGIALFWFMWKYDAAQNPEPVKFTHGSHTLEIIWSILPAVTLLFIAIYQMNAWADAKLARPMVTGADGTQQPMPPMAEVTGRQFEWRIRYPGDDGIIGTEDDLFDVNELHVPMDQEVVIRIQSEDVLHSFFLPNMRVKQDLVPGFKQHVWFKAIRDGKYDIVCAELCGWGHYKMKGQLVVDNTREVAADGTIRNRYQEYLDGLKRYNTMDSFPPKTEGAE